MTPNKRPHLIFPFTEPIGSVAPKITSGDDFRRLKAAQNQDIAFLCPAQASPIAIYR